MWYQCNTVVKISIHALLAESDQLLAGAIVSAIISIHALLAESDGQGRVLIFGDFDFYPRSPCGERRLDITIIGRTWDISIHALLAESDADRRNLANNLMAFLSTLSLRRATRRRLW